MKKYFFQMFIVLSCLGLNGCISAYLTYGMIDEKYLMPRWHKKVDACLDKQRELFQQTMKRDQTKNEDLHIRHGCIRSHRYSITEDSVFKQCRAAECVENSFIGQQPAE